MGETLCQKFIVVGLIFLIIFAPLAFGTVGLGSITILELVVFFLVIIWLLKGKQFIKTPLKLSLLFFLSLILFQLCPLPPKLLNFLSPTTYSLYKMTIPGYNLVFPWRSLSVYQYATALEFFKIAAYTGAFFLVINNLKDKSQIHRFILIIIFMGLFEASYGLLEYLSGHQRILFLKKTEYQAMVTGTFVNKNHFAGYLEMIIPFCFGLLIISPTKFPLKRFKRWEVKIFFIVIIAIISFAVILSRSRMGIFGLVSSLIFMSGMFVIERIHKASLRLFAIIIGLALLAGIFTGISRGLNLEMPLDKGRIQQYKGTTELIKDFPLLGTGLGTYGYVYPGPSSHAHNDYLELLSETGIIGFAILILGIGLFLWRLVKAWFKIEDSYRRWMGLSGLTAIAVILLHSLVDFNLHIPANVFLFLVIVGLTHNLIFLE
jgi:O-antigen ligase